MKPIRYPSDGTRQRWPPAASNACTIATMASEMGKPIELPSDLTEWLVDKAIKHHGRDYGAALVQVLREAKAREDGQPAGPKQVAEPVDLWAGITAEARTRQPR